MKVCPNCGKEFDGDINFCSACGTKLISPNACPNCGAEISDDAQFCPKCGAKLSYVKKCKSCGFETEDDFEFCPKCGKELEKSRVSNQVAASGNKSASTTPRAPLFTDKNKVKQVITYLALAFIGVAALLLTIGWFGDIVGGSALGEKASLSIKYYFGGYSETLKEIKEGYKYGDAYMYELFTYIFDCIFYFAGLVVSLITLVLGLLDASKNVKANKPIEFKYFIASVLAGVPHIVFLGIRYSAELSSHGTSISAGYGWGIALMIAATFITIITVLVQKIAIAVVDKKNYIAPILTSVASIFMLVLCFWGNNLVIAQNQSVITVNASSFSLVQASIRSYSSNHDTIEKFGEMIIGSVLIVFSSICMFAALITIMKKNVNVAGPVILTIMSLGFTIISSAILSSALKCSFGSTTIMTIVIGVLALVALFAIPVLEKQKTNA